MKRFLLASVFLLLSSCTALPPVVLSGSYTLPGGKGVISFHTPLEPSLPAQPGLHEATLFPLGQK